MALIERKSILSPRSPMQPTLVLYASHFDERGVDLFRAVCEMDLEGIVAKKKDGLYSPDETSWVKIKNRNYSQLEGRREFFAGRRAAHS